MLVQFSIFGLITSAMILMTERRSRTLMRLITTRISRAGIIGGHVIAMFLIVLFQEVVLVSLGQLVFGVNYLAAPAGTLLMMVAVAAWASSMGLLIGALARKEQQVVAFSLAAMFVFAALGGAWFPLDVAGKAFARVGGLLPSAWAMTGFQNIVLRELGSGSALLPAGLILVWAAAFFGIATWRFKFE
jgi:ABC-2 type transport system permease protein